MPSLSRLISLGLLAATSLVLPPVAGRSDMVNAAHSHHARVHGVVHRANHPKRQEADDDDETSEAAAADSESDTTGYDEEETEDSTDAPSSNSTVERRAFKQGKGGLAWLGWPNNKNLQKEFLKGDKVTWCYSWSPWPCSTEIESVPMLWSEKQLSAWNKNVKGKHWKHVLAFNEPDQKGQSNMSVDKAIGLWRNQILPINADRRGAPAVTTSPNGIAWITSFVKKCTGCKIAFVPVHYYGMSSDDFKKRLTQVHNQTGKPVWVTEWACQNFGDKSKGQCSAAKVKSFLKETQSFMDNTDWVERYSWFGTLNNDGMYNVNRANQMFTNGHINDLGREYIN